MSKCRCKTCEAARQRARRETPEWKKWKKKYSASSKGKLAGRRYKTGISGKNAARRYKAGRAGRAARIRWSKSEKGKKAKAKCIRNRRRRDLNFRIRCSLTCRLVQALKSQKTVKTNRIPDLLGCSIPDFKIYLESKWEEGMSWGNYGKLNGQWAIDHIIPVSIFDLTIDDHQRRCFHFSNMQPMWQRLNILKSNYVMVDTAKTPWISIPRR